MAKTLANYDPLVQIPSGMTPAGADFPIVESHDILVGENDKRLDAKLDDIDSAIGNVGQTPIATQLSSKVNTGDIVTSVAATGSTSNNKIPSETAVRAAIEAKTINVDTTVTQGSTNAVSGGAVHTQLATKQDVLTFDTTPTASSSNPVTSGGVKSALDTKQDTLTFDTTPTASSSNPVTSGGVKAALDTKQNTLTYETTPIVGSVNPVTSTGIRNAIDAAAAGNLGQMQAAYDTFSANISARVSSLSNGMVACSNIAAETTVGDTRILLYTGTTNDNYTNGHWYYNSAPSNAAPSWTDGGAVGSAPTIDNTLAIDGAAANSKSVGDAIENIVTISDTQPGSNSGNKVWIKETTNEEVQVPTYAEHIAKANKADIATNNESDNGSGTITASKAYAIGDHFYINNTNTSSENYGVSTLYKATAAIASGDAIVVGTNCEASKVADEITSLSNDLDILNESLGDVMPIVTDEVVSTNVFNPVSTRVYPESGTAVINTDKSITITNVQRLSNVWIFAQDSDPITLEAGNYTLCFDEGLFSYGNNTVKLQVKIGTNAYTDIVSATGEQTAFTLDTDMTGLFRVQYVASSSNYVTNWTGHIWINKGDTQTYIPVGVRELLPKEFVDADQGEENSGKILSVNVSGKVSLIDNPLGTVVSDELYQKGNLLKWDDIAKGYIKSNGEVQSYNSLWCSGFCEVEEGNIYCNAVSGNINVNQYFAFYRADKSFLASWETTGGMQKLTSDIRYLTVPEGAKYFRCTFSADQSVNRKAWISNKPENPYENDSYNVKNVYPYVVSPSNPCDYSELTVRAFSKVVCIGDSLTYGGFNLANSGSATGETQSSAELALRYSYPSNFQRITGIETVNAGDSGESSVSWYQQHQNDDFSQFDLAIIHLGVNDSAFSVSDEDTLTAMQNIVTMLSNARSNMRIAICSVIPAYDGTGYQAKGQLILNWAKGLNNPNIIPLDLAQYSHVRPRTSYVAGHLSALGYYMMAYDIARYISWYMDNHKRDFRFIQFIGSPDAVYDYD